MTTKIKIENLDRGGNRVTVGVKSWATDGFLGSHTLKAGESVVLEVDSSHELELQTAESV
jgi:hypothetical protein